MKILFVSCCCSKAKNEELFKLRNRSMIIPSQKFFNILLRGIDKGKNASVTCMTALAVSRSTTKKYVWKEEEEADSDTLRYTYLPFLNGKILRYVTLCINARRYTKKWIKENKGEECCVLTDCLIWPCAIPAQKVAQKNGVKTFTVVTDLPEYAEVKKNNSATRSFVNNLVSSITKKSIGNYDGYVFLTEAMASVVGKKDSRHIVVECSVDEEDIPELRPSATEKTIFMYAGGVYRKYGLVKFVEAFERTADDNAELWIFGDGDFVDELTNGSQYSHTIYKGCVSVAEIIKFERQASVLVNPRPVGDEYNKYSFPSKTAEYMTTGVPVLSTRLPGIPEDYEPYLLWFESDTIGGYCDGIKQVLRMDKEKLREFGLSGQEFCRRKKSNVTQGRKIVDFLAAEIK